MTPEQQAAFMQSQASCAIVEAIGMMAENFSCQAAGQNPRYTKDNFDQLILKYNIHHNAVIGYLNRY